MNEKRKIEGAIAYQEWLNKKKLQQKKEKRENKRKSKEKSKRPKSSHNEVYLAYSIMKKVNLLLTLKCIGFKRASPKP